MGKEGRKMRATLRKGPFPSRSSKQEAGQSTKMNIDTIKQQLQMPNCEEKMCALQSIGTYLESEDFVKSLVEKGIVRIMFPLLLDENSEVRNMTAGALRNFSALNLDACEYLIEQDVMTILVSFFRKYDVNWVPKNTHGHLDEDGDTFLHGVHLLWNLCESSGVPVKYVNDSHMLPILIRCIDRKVFGDDLVTAIVHCLFVVIEDNSNAITEISNLCETPLNQLLISNENTPIDILLKTLASGIILNIKYPNVSDAPRDFLQSVIQILNDALSIDVRSLCHKISSSLPLESTSKHTKQNAEIQKEINSLKNAIDSQQTAIEILTNMCSPEDEVMDVDEASDMDSDMDEDNSSCDANGSGAGAVYEAIRLPLEIKELIISFNIIKKIYEKTTVLAENVFQILKESEEGRYILNRYSSVQSRAFLCMNNFIENIPIEILGGYKELYNLWIDTGKMVFKSSGDDKNEDVLESATAVMRATLDRLKSGACQSDDADVIVDLFKGISPNDLQDVLNGITQCEKPEIRLNLTRMLGNLVLILGTKSSANPSETEIVIVTFLTDRIFKETECWTLAELLDTIMDVFAEDETDKLARQINLIEKLVEISPVIKNKIRQQKKTLGDHAAVVSTVAANLPRFIKYKKRRVDVLNGS